MIVMNKPHGDKFLLADYVIERWIERGDGDEASLIEHLENAVRFGGQCGDNQMLYTHNGHVFPAKRLEGQWVIKTVLTKAMAVANMQQKGLVGALPQPGADQPAKKQPLPRVRELNQRDPAEYSPDAISRLAAQHAFAGLAKKQRYEEMRAAGMNPNGTVGDVYRVAFAAANYLMKALNAACQETAPAGHVGGDGA